MTQWRVPGGRVQPPGERVLHVWRIDVRQPDAVLRELRATLTRDEEERAALYRFDRDRRSFECTRGALRALAGSYLGVAPRDLRFEYAAKGKPGLPGLSFNVSHSGGVAFAAFAASGRVGVDVEEMRPDVDFRALARRFFSSNENAVLDRLEGDELLRGFYACWTRKEAFVKALGEGLSFDLDCVEVSVDDPARILSFDGAAGTAARWSLSGVAPGAGYAGAVVAEGSAREVVLWDWPGLSVMAA